MEAAEKLAKMGLSVGVINARFVKPLDQDLIRKIAQESEFIVTVEEASLVGGFGSAVLECLNQTEFPQPRLTRLGIPDRFIEHGDRQELLADLGLDAAGIAKTCLQLAEHAELIVPN
jgi:1-deoxy-D-xylulose-5-phosphate synthase